jgi:hypothetical protein
MKRLIVSIIMMSIPVWTSAGLFGQEPNQPNNNMAAPNQYQCPKHSEITASWPVLSAPSVEWNSKGAGRPGR